MTFKNFFTCYITERDGVWEGICVDFDIAVEGRSREDTRARLDVAVHSYLLAMVQEAPEQRERLLHRRTPWATRASLATGAALQRFKGQGRRAERFTMPCHV